MLLLLMRGELVLVVGLALWSYNMQINRRQGKERGNAKEREKGERRKRSFKSSLEFDGDETKLKLASELFLSPLNEDRN